MHQKLKWIWPMRRRITTIWHENWKDLWIKQRVHREREKPKWAETYIIEAEEEQKEEREENPTSRHLPLLSALFVLLCLQNVKSQTLLKVCLADGSWCFSSYKAFWFGISHNKRKQFLKAQMGMNCLHIEAGFENIFYCCW